MPHDYEDDPRGEIGCFHAALCLGIVLGLSGILAVVLWGLWRVVSGDY